MLTRVLLPILVLVFNLLPLHSAELMIQVGDTNTSSTGNWYEASGATQPINTNRGLYANVNSTISTYQFLAVMPLTTSYTLQVYNTCYSPRSQQVSQNLQYSQGVELFVTDQDCLTDPWVGQWRTLGVYSFQQGEQVNFTISTDGSNNRYVGASAIRYIYSDDGSPPINNNPELTVSMNELEVESGALLILTASATDQEDGNISSHIQWRSPILNTMGEEYRVEVSNDSFNIEVSITDSHGSITTQEIIVHVNSATMPSNVRRFEFGCSLGTVSNLSLLAFNANALPNVGAMCNRYTAQLMDNNENQTLFFNQTQGRLDAIAAQIPLTATLRNVGIAPVNQPGQLHIVDGFAYNFVGLQIHHRDFSSINSAHLVVGQRGNITNTIEGKKTLNGSSAVNDIGMNRLPNGRADIRLSIDSNGHITAFWQQPNLTGNAANDNWQLYRGNGALPGANPDWGDSNQVLVGIITYAYYSNGVPFWGVADSLEIIEE